MICILMVSISRFLYESLSDDGSSAAPTHRILYTGDFRFENIPLTSLNALHLNLEPIQVDEMYLDTTFCTPKYPTFPDRDEALRGIWEIVSGWIRKNGMYRKQRAKHVVLFHLPGEHIHLRLTEPLASMYNSPLN